MLRPYQIAPRGLTKEQAAAYCGCGLDALDTWVKRGIVPGPIPGTQRWDRKAIDCTLIVHQGSRAIRPRRAALLKSGKLRAPNAQRLRASVEVEPLTDKRFLAVKLSGLVY